VRVVSSGERVAAGRFLKSQLAVKCTIWYDYRAELREILYCVISHGERVARRHSQQSVRCEMQWSHFTHFTVHFTHFTVHGAHFTVIAFHGDHISHISLFTVHSSRGLHFTHFTAITFHTFHCSQCTFHGVAFHGNALPEPRLYQSIVDLYPQMSVDLTGNFWR